MYQSNDHHLANEMKIQDKKVKLTVEMGVLKWSQKEHYSTV